MGYLERGLSKLTISAYQDRELRKLVGTLQAMYNPESIGLSYSTDYVTDEHINSTQQSSRYQQVRPGELNLKLVFDALLPGNRKTVDAQLAQLRALCCSVLPETQETPFLKVVWGKMNWSGQGYYAGRMAAMSVNYSLFDRNATPLRAEASLSLRTDESLLLQKSLQGQSAPQVGTLSVPAMSSLALIAAGVATGAGAVSAGVDYLALAAANGLSNLNDFSPGDTLVVP
ncbi:hypothetical protein A3218_05695 [Pseudomonas chlororaphis]|uniref:CIS tube protein n=1 Tax=Pseudomonas chlororaphis TaxID=587753 RepID=UPI000789F022|nr:hypothetical protein [Pseudomonas chlororaphis]AMS13812.1 hypothetical protein A3218_05695 [Pseudomonas chlororaphis]